MFNDLFNFKRQRTLKESIGFFIFYGTIALAVSGIIELSQMGSSSF